MSPEPDLPYGLYDELVTSELEDQLRRLVSGSFPEERALGNPEAADRFALHVATALRRAIDGIEEKDRARAGSALVQELLRLMGARSRKYQPELDLPKDEPSVLEGLFRLNPDGTPRLVPPPVTPLLDTTILTNAKGEPNLWKHLSSEIDSASGVDVIMAFIRRSGIRPLKERLGKLAAQGMPLRFITTTYTGSTEPEALEELQDLGATIKVSYEIDHTRLHAKAWIFHRPRSATTAFVGSSNLTRQAADSGLEWNVRLSSRRNPDAVAKMEAAFESYWASEDFIDFDPQEFRRRMALQAKSPGVDLGLDVHAFPFQDRLLDQIAAAREAGHHRNLLVAATGTGKTVMAALDFARLHADFRRRKLRPPRLLFVAHREEILEQSRRTFRQVMRDANFGETWVGGRRPSQFEHVFASIQSLSASGLTALDPDHFDVVVVDEFHHAAASSYQKLLEFVQPKELLGLTATPERADGLSVFDYFDGRIAAELRIWDAIADQRLVPFHYYGLHDGTSLEEVPWKRGRGYDVEALTGVYTSDDAWARLVFRKTGEHVDDVRKMRALGFCVSVGHAQFMAARFRGFGVPAVAVWGDSPAAERRQALLDLKSGAVNVVFSVDLFNEGVDVPDVDTLLLMRPTESATLFLQQLGRGLRRSPNKDVCTVLDFIGQHRKEFRFDSKLRAVTGGSRKDVESDVKQGFPHMPPGVSFTFDRVAQEIVLNSIRNALPSTRPTRVKELRAMVAAGHEATLANYLAHSGLELGDVYANKSSWSDLVEAAGLDIAVDGPHEAALRKAIGRILHIDDAQRISCYRRLLGPGTVVGSGAGRMRPDASPNGGAEEVRSLDTSSLTEIDRRLWRMLLVQLTDSISSVDKASSLQSASDLLFAHPNIAAEIRELLGVLAASIDHTHIAVPGHPEWPLQVHASYTRGEILAALGSRPSTASGDLAVPEWREGVKWLPDARADAFLLTLNKSGGNFSPTTQYRDYAISRHLFHWESQSTTSAESPTGQRYINHVAMGSEILLFARMTTASRAFWFLGPATFVSYKGDRPMAITWRLGVPLPADLHADFSTIAV